VTPTERPGTPSLLSAEEMRVVVLLARVWDAFMKLPLEHPDHQTEFRMAIHRAQYIILSRPALREVFGSKWRNLR